MGRGYYFLPVAIAAGLLVLFGITANVYSGIGAPSELETAGDSAKKLDLIHGDKLLEHEVLAEGRAHDTLVRKASALAHSIASLTQAVRDEENEISHRKGVVKTDVLGLKNDMQAITKAFKQVKAAEHIQDVKATFGQKLTKVEQQLADQHDTLEKQAETLDAQAKTEASNAAAARKNAELDASKYKDLMAQASKEKQTLEKEEADEAEKKAEAAAAAAKAREAKEEKEAEEKRHEEEEKTKAEKKKEEREEEEREEKKEDDASQTHKSLAQDDRPEREADAILQQAEDRHLKSMYERWTTRAGHVTDRLESIQLFCGSRFDSETSPMQCAEHLLNMFEVKKSSGMTRLRQQQRNEEEEQEKVQARLLEKARGQICDPSSPTYLHCLGVRATGATLVPAKKLSHLTDVNQSAKIVAAKLQAAKAREITNQKMRKLGLNDLVWGSDAKGGKESVIHNAVKELGQAANQDKVLLNLVNNAIHSQKAHAVHR